MTQTGTHLSQPVGAKEKGLNPVLRRKMRLRRDRELSLMGKGGELV